MADSQSRKHALYISATSGMYVPVPVLNDPGGPLVIDMVAKGYGDMGISITCEITDEQAASSDPREGVFFVFAKNDTDDFVGLPGDYKTNDTALVPDVIGIGFSAYETVPIDSPYLLLMSRTANPAEVRIRVV